MKHFNIPTYILSPVDHPEKSLQETGEKNNRSNPHNPVVGINFANILAGNLYPEAGLYIKKD